MKETYLTAEQITRAFKISKEKLSLMVKNGLFPRPIKLNERATLWKESAVKNWVEARHQTEDMFNSINLDTDLF
jgi:predicted DNA-binding transcriptional regulator AlpA